MSLTLHIEKQLENFDLNVALECHKGELTALVGPSGAGKSTLIRVIAGLEKPNKAEIKLDNIVFDSSTKKISLPPRKRKIGMVFQDYTLFPHLNVLDNICFASNDKEYVKKLIRDFKINHIKTMKPNKISGGEKQRVAFCQALASKPDILLLDEPFSALDVETRENLRELLLSLKKELNIPILHVTHDLDEAYQLADNLVAIEAGKISKNWLLKQQKRHTQLQNTLYFHQRTA